MLVSCDLVLPSYGKDTCWLTDDQMDPRCVCGFVFSIPKGRAIDNFKLLQKDILKGLKTATTCSVITKKQRPAHFTKLQLFRICVTNMVCVHDIMN
jgi:hypothetical protein